jgi:hypothetical protein
VFRALLDDEPLDALGPATRRETDVRPSIEKVKAIHQL